MTQFYISSYLLNIYALEVMNNLLQIDVFIMLKI